MGQESIALALPGILRSFGCMGETLLDRFIARRPSFRLALPSIEAAPPKNGSAFSQHYPFRTSRLRSVSMLTRSNTRAFAPSTLAASAKSSHQNGLLSVNQP